jgi:hypothetical protein
MDVSIEQCRMPRYLHQHLPCKHTVLCITSKPIQRISALDTGVIVIVIWVLIGAFARGVATGARGARTHPTSF